MAVAETCSILAAGMSGLFHFARIVFSSIPLIIISVLLAQSPAAPVKYEPSEVEQLRLQLAAKDAQIAQIQFQNAQYVFQQAIARLHAEADKVKAEHKWPAEVQFKPETLTFAVPAPPKPPVPEKKPLEKKP